ncbi:MAG: hypothetical protein XE10_0261 [Methanoculleus marisnigri]|uniref:Uncharacterized protein n=1 Tax=Methanoculleus marisnigri TaxID=2198 RepID=A0A117MHZ3_9EURY|nr:MAG: hypothetical protein XE10_0261 [Methanoculleus marisnigri]
MRLSLRTWEVRLGIVLIAFAAAVYTAKYLLLGDPVNTYQYIFNALGFLPINVLLVTLILNQLLSIRAKRERLEKLNMVIGTFFSEVGTGLLTFLSDHDPRLPEVQQDLVVTDAWTPEIFSAVPPAREPRPPGARIVHRPPSGGIPPHRGTRTAGGLLRAPGERHRPPQRRHCKGVQPARRAVARLHGVSPEELPLPLLACDAEQPLRRDGVAGCRVKRPDTTYIPPANLRHARSPWPNTPY